jgi:hypothetical protein
MKQPNFGDTIVRWADPFIGTIIVSKKPEGLVGPSEF